MSDCLPCQKKHTSNGVSQEVPLRAPESPSVSLGPISIIHTAGTQDTVWERVGAALPDYVASWSNGALECEKGPDGTVPPSPPEGFRVDPADPWRFLPVWPSCKQRVYTLSLSEPPRADIVIAAECFHPATDQHVNLSVCEACPHRQEIVDPLAITRRRAEDFRSKGHDLQRRPK